MRESLNDKLSGFLDIENKIEETSKNVVKKQESNIQEFNSSEMREQDLANDYNEHRETLKDLVSQGQDALQNLLQHQH